MEYRPLGQSFKQQVENLLKWHFGSDTTTPIYKYFFSLPEYWATMYGWVDGADLVSLWNPVPMELFIRQQKVRTYFIEDAITLPNYRNRGLIKQAFLANCRKAMEEGIDFLALTPFKHQYYHKLGFASAFNRFRLKMPLHLISKTGSSEGFRIKTGELKQDEQLRTDFYSLTAQYWTQPTHNEHKYTKWGDKYLEYIKNRRIAIVYSTDSKPPTPQGFLIYGEKNRQLIINGFRYNSFGAFTALKKYITAYQDQVDSIHCTSLPEDFPIESFIHSYWTGKDQVVFSYEPSKMLRVVSPKAALEKFVNPTSLPTKPVSLLIEDALLPENSGIYTITENKTVQFNNTMDSSYDLEISIQALAQFITGRFSAQELYRCGELRLQDNAEISYLELKVPEKITVLDALFPKMVTFYPEYD